MKGAYESSVGGEFGHKNKFLVLIVGHFDDILPEVLLKDCGRKIEKVINAGTCKKNMELHAVPEVHGVVIVVQEVAIHGAFEGGVGLIKQRE
jgi:hypothetical protein